MTSFPETRESLIVQIRDPMNRAAWEQFVDLYRPVIYRTALARGLQDADAQDLAQQVLMAVASAIGRWEKSNSSARFRHWLRRVTRNAIINALTRRRQDAATGTSSVVALLNGLAQREPDVNELIQLEYRREFWLRAAGVVRAEVSSETWQAFELTTLCGLSKAEAATRLGKPIGLIYAARSRVMKRLRDFVAELEALQKRKREPTCDPQQLARFLKGDLTAQQEQDLTAHLSHCDACGTELESRAAKPSLWSEANEMLSGAALTRKDQSAWSQWMTKSQLHCSELQVEQVLQSLSPTDDPGMLGRIGGYEVSGVVGSGGMGVVLKVHDPSLDRIVAIKVMAPHLASSGSARKRFAREAKAAAAVLHPNVIAIHGVSNDESLPYLVMPYIRGQSLQKRIDSEGPLPLKDILRIGAQIAAGLAAAHEQGLVHRDIKPANILLEDGVERVAITDFGLARAVDDASMTNSGVITGTPQYMSPEQARGESIDARSDLFSLGSLLYAMCTGHSPFRAETSYGVLNRISNEASRPIRDINSDTPTWLCRLIERLLEKEADRRFQSASKVEQLLTASIAYVEQPDKQPLPNELHQTERRCFRWLLPGLAGGLFVATVSGAIAMMGDNDMQHVPSLPEPGSRDDTKSQAENTRHETGTEWVDSTGTSATEIQTLATEIERESRSPFKKYEDEGSPATRGERR